MLRSSLASSSLMPSCSDRSPGELVADRAPRLHLTRDFLVAEVEDGERGRRPELLASQRHGVQTAVAFRNARRNCEFAVRACRNTFHFEKMMAQDTTEKIARMAKTTIVKGVESLTRSNKLT